MADADLVSEVGRHVEGVPVGGVDIAVVPASELECVIGRPVVVVVDVHGVRSARSGVDTRAGVVLHASNQPADIQELEVHGVGQVD